MKRLVALASLLAAGCASALAQGAQPPAALRIELYDGTRLNGPALEPGLQFSSSLGEKDVPWEQVAVVTMNTDNGDLVELAKGGRVSGRVKTTVIGLSTVLGKARLPLAKIKRVTSLAQKPEGGPTGGLAPASPNLKQGLVLYFSFNGDSRARAADESGNGNDGRRNGGHFTADGLFRGAYQFGGQDFIEVPTAASLCPQQLTVSAWIRPGEDVGGEGHVILSKENGPTGYWLGYRGLPSGRHAMTFALIGMGRGGMYSFVSSPKKFKGGTWYHVAGVYDGRKQQIFVDGEFEDSADRSGAIGTGPQSLVIGSQSTPHVFGWEGLIDEVRIYDRALDGAEIRQLAVRAAPAVPAAGSSATGARALHVEIDLADRTMVKGTATWTSLPLAHATLGALNIPWNLVTGVAVSEGDTARVELNTGDLFSGQMQFEKASVDSALGRVSIPRGQIRAIRVTEPDAAVVAPSAGGTLPGAAGTAPSVPPRRGVREDGATKF